jgi:two-component system CheB/CheR fusion protein
MNARLSAGLIHKAQRGEFALTLPTGLVRHGQGKGLKMPKQEVQAHDGRLYVRQVLPYRTRDNRTEGVVITLSDVAAEALQEARLYAESIVDTVREPLLVLGGDLRVLSANRSCYTTFKVSEEETAGRSLYELGNRQWDIPQLRILLGKVLPQKQVLNDLEVEHDFEAMGPRTMLLNARALLRGGDRPDLILLAIEDVTERRQIQEALREGEARQQVEGQVRQRQTELAHALRISTVGELASGLAHELAQPLSAIANGVEACARYVRSGSAQSSKLLALLDDASAEALRAGDIVAHLRGFIEKGQPQFERTDLREIARNVPRLLGHEIEREQITLRLDLGPEPLPIYADRIQIEQVVVNLMQNAIDAVRETSHRRGIQLSTRTVKGMAEVAVHDTGAGVSAAAAERLSEPFFTTKPKGLGMGLAISRSIIEAHQGRIWVESPGNGGPGMTVRFRAAAAAAEAGAGRGDPRRRPARPCLWWTTTSARRKSVRALFESAASQSRPMPWSRIPHRLRSGARRLPPARRPLATRQRPDLQDELRRRKATLPIIVLTGHGNVPTSVRALKPARSTSRKSRCRPPCS